MRWSFIINFVCYVGIQGVTTLGTSGNNIQGTGSSNAGAIAGGVIVVLLVVGAATAVAIVLVVLLLQRRNQQKSIDLSHSADGFNNELYDRQIIPGSINGKSILPVDGKDGADNTPHDYADVQAAGDGYYEEMNVRFTIFIH